MTNGSTDILALQLKSGDTKAYEDIYNRYFTSILFFAKKFLYVHQDAEDVAIESFIKLWQYRTNFDSTASIYTWLKITTRNACLDFLESLQIRSEKQDEIRRFLMDEPDSVFELEDYEAAVIDRVNKEIALLPGQCRTVFELRFLEGMKFGDIAGKLNISESAVKTQYTRATKRLKLGTFSKGLVVLFPALPYLGSWL